MATREDAIRKLRALLNRSGRSEAEATTAQMLAAALAEKHGIDLQEIDQTDPSRPVQITHKNVGEWAKSPAEATYASLICGRWFEVLPLLRSGFTEQEVFIGTPGHIEIAEYVFVFLIGEFRRAWNRRKTRSKARKAFIYGAYLALYAKLHDQFASPAAAIRSDMVLSLKAKREEYLSTTFGLTTKVDVKPQAKRSVAANHGWRAGREIEIRPGVKEGPRAPQQAALPGFGGRRAIGWGT